MISRFTLTVLVCLFSLPAYADMLVPLNLFAEKSKDTSKENVFVWNDAQYSCDSPSPLYFKTEQEAKKLCGLCPNRKITQVSGGDEYGNMEVNGKHYYSCENSHCLKCSDEGWCGGELGSEEVKDVYECAPKSIKKCPSQKPQLDTFGFCHSCDEEKGIDVSWIKIEKIYNHGKYEFMPEEGFVCGNRKLISVGHGHLDFYSVLNTCPSKRPLQDYMGKCHSCDETTSIIVEKGRYSTTQVRNESCSNRKDARFDELFGYYTVFNIMKECPKDKPLRDEHGGCHSCDEPEEIIQDEKTVAVWGSIINGKVYDANSNEVGKIVEKNTFKPRFDVEYIWDMYDMKNKKIALVKIEFDSVCIDKDCGSFHANIYDLKGGLIAHGKGEYNGTAPQKNESTYYWENVSDRTCPNRKMYRKDIKEEWGYRPNQLVSGLKKE